HLPTTCSSGRAYTRALWLAGFDGPCAQTGITEATPANAVLGTAQTPPRFVQDFLDPYIRNESLWFCPSVGTERYFLQEPKTPTYGYNSTTYQWNEWPTPSAATEDNPYKALPGIDISGMALAAIPRPAEAPLLFDMPFWNPLAEPCTSRSVVPPHA